MFFFFLFGCMEIRAEDCLTGIGYRDLELNGSSLGLELDSEAIGFIQWIGSLITLGNGEILVARCCIM